MNEQQPLGRLLAIAGRMLGARFQRVLDDSGMTHAGWAVLNALAHEDGLTLRQVADRTYVTPASVTGVVDTLERDGLVRRDRSAADRRQIHVYLTQAGAASLGHAKQRVADALAPVFGDLPEGDEAVVRRFLTTTIERLGGSAEPDAAPPGWPKKELP